MCCCGLFGKKKNKKGKKASGGARPYQPPTSSQGPYAQGGGYQQSGGYQQTGGGYPAASQQQRKNDPAFAMMLAENMGTAKKAAKYVERTAPLGGPTGVAIGKGVQVALPRAAKEYTNYQYNRQQAGQPQPQQQEMSQQYYG